MADDNKSSASNINLDLSNIDDPEQLASSIETFYRNDSSVKAQLSWSWERNQLMLDGKQWIVYDSSSPNGGMWKPVQVSSQNEYIPRPVTNYIMDAYQTLKGYLLKTKPRITVRPNSNSSSDKNAAKLATLVSETNYEQLLEDINYEYAAACLVGYGTVFKKSYWDTSYVRQVKVPKMEIVPQIDPATGAITGQAERPVIDPATGEEVFETLPLGDVNTEVVEPYRIATDPLANDLHKMRWIMEYSIQPMDWVKTVYGKEEPGYFPENLEELKPEPQLNNSMRRFFSLKASSGVKNGLFQGDAGLGAETVVQNTVVVKEYYERPSAKHPNGRLIVVANNKTLYMGDSPCQGNDLGDWHPFSECRWEIVPGRFWGKGPLDDGAELQKKINSIDATVILTRKTMAVPQKKIPLGIGVEPGKWTGRPGQEVFYRPDGTGASPETIPASGVDASVFTERAQTLEDFKQITGAIDILKGDRPPGVTAASALSMLYEVGTGKLFPVLGRWKRFIENDQKKQLKLIAQKYKEPRAEFIRLLQTKNQDLSPEEISNFIGADLYDNCNVIIEAGSNIPKLQAAEQALLLEVAQTGSLQLEAPANRSEFLTRLGIIGFDNDIGPDTKRAEWENDIIKEFSIQNENRPVVLVTDNHPIHREVHSRMAKEPSFLSLPFEVQKLLFSHIAWHDEMEAQNAQMQAMSAAATGAPMPQMSPPPSEAQEDISPAGKGVSSKMSDAIFSDALVPGLAKPTRGGAMQ